MPTEVSSKAEGRDDHLRGRDGYACSQVDGQTTSDHVEYNSRRLHANQVPEVTTSIRWHGVGSETCDGVAVRHTHGGVDKADQLLSYYGFSHRPVKWWRHAFFGNAIVNAYILYRLSVQPEQKMDNTFRLSLQNNY